MKVKLGNRSTTLPKEAVVAHMANLLTTRAIILGKEKDFKKSFSKYNELCILFLGQNKMFIYSFGDELWLEEFLNFQSELHEMLLQDVVFKFNDGSTWSIALSDLANLKIINESTEKHDKGKLLAEPIDLVFWAQTKLSWDQVKDLSTLRMIDDNISYKLEWPSVPKKIIKWQYQSTPNNDL